jgi:futalosine hydrolase
MHILLTAATDFELNTARKSFELFTNSNHQLTYLNTGLGIASTCFELGTFFSNNLPELAINIGIAGTFNPSINTGEVLLVQQDLFAWFGAENGDKFEPFKISGQFDQDKSAENLFVASHSIYNSAFEFLRDAKGITVQSVLGNLQSIKKAKKHYQPDLESMEGAAFYFCCLKKNIPAYQIRAISNKVEVRDKSKWEIENALVKLEIALNKVAENILEIS